MKAVNVDRDRDEQQTNQRGCGGADHEIKRFLLLDQFWKVHGYSFRCEMSFQFYGKATKNSSDHGGIFTRTHLKNSF